MKTNLTLLLTQEEIMKIVNKEQASQRILYKKLYIKYFALALRYAEDKTEATSVFNDAMLKIYKLLETKTSDEITPGFIATVIRNTAIDQVRKKVRYRNNLQQYQQENEDTQSHELNTALDRLNVHQLLSIISSLDYNKRMVFYMKEVDGYSHEEIADRLEISIGNSKWILSTAKKILRQKINETYPELKLRS